MDHTHCSASLGICGSVTYGQGELDDYGYWKKPCRICAREAEKKGGVPVNTYWPFEKKTYRIVRVIPEDNCSRDFLCKFRVIVEELVNGEVVYATPLKTLDEIWDIIGDNLFEVI